MTRPIEGVGTAVAAFVGLADAGPIDSPETFDGWGSYEDEYGGRTGSGAMGHQVWDFFENGGRHADRRARHTRPARPRALPHHQPLLARERTHAAGAEALRRTLNRVPSRSPLRPRVSADAV